MVCRRLGFLLVSASLSLLCCSTLPEFAAPKGAIVDAASVDASDMVPYGTIARTDFRGAQPPPWFAANADQIGAATCAQILTTPETRVLVRGVRAPDGTVVYEATPEKLRFYARMDRKCSWWNPKDLGVPEEYILEHEQIHFALFELEARKLNASIQEIEAKMHATASTPDAATQAAQENLQAQLQEVLSSILERSREFDEDTSMGHKPEQQKEWWARVQAELAATRHLSEQP